MQRLGVLLLATLCSFNLFAAERGDIVSYELVKEWNNDVVVEESFKLVEGYTSAFGDDPELKEGVKNFLISYIKRNIQARSLKFYRLKFHTIDFNDQPAIASGLVIVPQRPAATCKYGVALYGHGTLFGREEAPSFYFDNGRYRSGELFFSVIMAAMEHFTLVPDYFGLGSGTGLHHHNMFKTNSNSNIDMIRAGRKLAKELNMELTERVVITGYSEGGSVTMGTAKLIYDEGLQNEFPQVFLGPASGAYDLSGEAYKFIVQNPLYPTRSYILYIASSCQDMYKNLVDPNEPNAISEYLKSPYDELYNINLLGQTGDVGWVPLPWPQMFNDGVIEKVDSDPNHPLRECLFKNNTYDWPNPYETLMYYCNTDEQVPPSGAVKAHQVQSSYITSNNFWDRFRLQISEMSYDGFFPDHGSCALPSMLFFLENMRSRKRNKCTPNRYADENSYDNIYHTLTINSEEASEDIRILDLKGGLKLTDRINSSKTEVDVSGLMAGIYLTERKANGQVEYDYFIKQPIQYVNTADYNPVMTQPMIEGTDLDISRLNEEVLRLEILDSQKKKVKVIPNESGAKDKIFISRGNFQEGDYTILVVTPERVYPLIMKVGAKSALPVANEKASFQTIVQENVIKIRANGNNELRAFELYDASGKRILAERGLQSNEYNIDYKSKGLSAGVYLVQLSGSAAKDIVKIVLP
jgi:hypothetical protein